MTLEGPKPSASSVSRKTLQVPTWRGWAAGRPGGQGGAQLQRHSPLRKANTVHGRTLAEYAECWHRRATDRAGRRTLEWTEFPHSVFPAFTQVPTGRGSPGHPQQGLVFSPTHPEPVHFGAGSTGVVSESGATLPVIQGPQSPRAARVGSQVATSRLRPNLQPRRVVRGCRGAALWYRAQRSMGRWASWAGLAPRPRSPLSPPSVLPSAAEPTVGLPPSGAPRAASCNSSGHPNLSEARDSRVSRETEVQNRTLHPKGRRPSVKKSLHMFGKGTHVVSRTCRCLTASSNSPALTGQGPGLGQQAPPTTPVTGAEVQLAPAWGPSAGPITGACLFSWCF